MSRSIDISETHKEIVQAILRKHLTTSCHVWVFGSRATWLAKAYSDLDLAIARKDGTPLSLTVMSALETAFEDSLLPWKVDVIDLHSVSEEFRAAIERDKVLFSFLVTRDTSLYIEKPLVGLIHIYDTMRKPVKKSDRTPGLFPYYGASGITDYVESFIFNGKFVLLAEDGDNLRTKNTPIAFIANGKFWVNNHAHVIQGNELADTTFICYALQIANIESYISGSTRPKITQADMKKIPIFCPPLPEQKAIAHILGTLDDKIELNRQTNQTLEAMAQALFQSWFVDFDPVIDKALAAGNEIPEAFQAKAAARQAMGDQRLALPEEVTALFPDSFVFTEEMGWVPEGWEVGTLHEIAIFKNGKTSPERTLGEFPVYGSNGLIGKCLEHNRENVIIIGRVGTYCGSLFYCNSKCWVTDNAISAEMKQKENNPYLLELLKKSALNNSRVGSGQPLLNQNILSTIKIIKPYTPLVTFFSKNSFKLYEKIFHTASEIKNLTTLRDTLLPKLISGELRVADAEKFMKEV